MNKNQKKITLIIWILLLTFTITSDSRTSNFYKNMKFIEYPSSINILVNKQYFLSNNYIPSDLVKLDIKYSNEFKYVRKEVKKHFEQMSIDAEKEGFILVGVSAFRSYKYQEELYQYYVNKHGLEYADKCSARPGHSEHQTGLSIDVMGENNDYDMFDDTKTFIWVKNNAHKYGFILRYPKGKEYITGFKYEPWHYRYVGVDTATYLYNNNLVLEEYLEKNGPY